VQGISCASAKKVAVTVSTKTAEATKNKKASKSLQKAKIKLSPFSVSLTYTSAFRINNST